MKWFSSFANFLGKGAIAGAIRGGTKFAGKSHLSAKSAFHNLRFQALPIALGLIGPGTPHEKMTNIAWNIAGFYATLGMNSGVRQALWGFAIGMTPQFGNMFRGILHGYRGTLEVRSSASIPFSHSSMAMDQAYATLQYSRSRMSDAYQNVGNEAPMFAARYMSR